jgi:hypothetical protein
MSTLFLIFNHQSTDARASLRVDRIVSLPPDLQDCWSHIPPDLPALQDHLDLFRHWLTAQARVGDYILIQGDFGACFLMVQFA